MARPFMLEGDPGGCAQKVEDMFACGLRGHGRESIKNIMICHLTFFHYCGAVIFTKLRSPVPQAEHRPRSLGESNLSLRA